MPDAPKVPDSPVQTQLGSGWFSDAPGGDIDLDQLFPNPELVPQAPAPAPQTQAAQQPVPAPDFFLESSTGTKYKTKEEAIKGIEEKDRVIATLRAEKKATEGVDPLKKQPLADQGNYLTNPERLFDDLVDSAQKGDKRKYAESLARFQAEQLAPYAPLLAGVAQEQAVRQAEAEMHGVREFVESPDFQAYLSTRPTLKNAVEFALYNPQIPMEQRKELIQIAYEASIGRKAPQLVQEAAQQVQRPANIPRPTLSPSTPTPVPLPAVSRPDLNTEEGRKAIIEAGKQRGLDRVDWESVGL